MLIGACMQAGRQQQIIGYTYRTAAACHSSSLERTCVCVWSCVSLECSWLLDMHLISKCHNLLHAACCTFQMQINTNMCRSNAERRLSHKVVSAWPSAPSILKRLFGAVCVCVLFASGWQAVAMRRAGANWGNSELLLPGNYAKRRKHSMTS